MGIRDANPNPNPNPHPSRYGLEPRPDPAQVLRASSEVFASALRDPSGRADEAVAARRRGGGLWFYVSDETVARRERTSVYLEQSRAYLEQCEGTLRAREEELAQNMLELRALRAQLRESPPKLTRTPPGAPRCVRVPAPPLRAVPCAVRT